MRIALIQLNPTVGATAENAARLLDRAHQAARAGATLAVASELCVTGYPPKDLLDRPPFVKSVFLANQQIIEHAPKGMALAFGSLGRDERGLMNDLIVASDGQQIGRASKQLLPTYDVFDEARYFEAGQLTTVATFAGQRLWLTVCEDAWVRSPMRPKHSARDPLFGLNSTSADLLINASASPFTLSKREARPRMFAELARSSGVPVVFVNQVGGNDELIFDGRSSAWSKTGALVARARAFAEDMLIFDSEGPATQIATEPDTESGAAYAALVLGLKDYVRKCGFGRVVLGLSGGIDSALTAAIAADALGPENVLGVAMPTRYSSAGSLSDARALAQNLGISFEQIDIDPIFDAYLRHIGPKLDALKSAPSFDVTLENIQARIRGNTLMAISNRSGSLVLTTGNKSELAVGYCTLYGDMAGGLAVISDVPKTLVYRLSRYVNRERERIPQASIDKAPSAELRPNQTDQDSLPPYDVLDAVLELYVEEQLGWREIVAQGFDEALVKRIASLIEGAEYKRRQAAPGLILTRKAFGPGRRMPVANGYRDWTS